MARPGSRSRGQAQAGGGPERVRASPARVGRPVFRRESLFPCRVHAEDAVDPIDGRRLASVPASEVAGGHTAQLESGRTAAKGSYGLQCFVGPHMDKSSGNERAGAARSGGSWLAVQGMERRGESRQRALGFLTDFSSMRPRSPASTRGVLDIPQCSPQVGSPGVARGDRTGTSNTFSAAKVRGDDTD